MRGGTGAGGRTMVTSGNALFLDGKSALGLALRRRHTTGAEASLFESRSSSLAWGVAEPGRDDNGDEKDHDETSIAPDEQGDTIKSRTSSGGSTSAVATGGDDDDTNATRLMKTTKTLALEMATSVDDEAAVDRGEAGEPEEAGAGNKAMTPTAEEDKAEAATPLRSPSSPSPSSERSGSVISEAGTDPDGAGAGTKMTPTADRDKDTTNGHEHKTMTQHLSVLDDKMSQAGDEGHGQEGAGGQSANDDDVGDGAKASPDKDDKPEAAGRTMIPRSSPPAPHLPHRAAELSTGQQKAMQREQPTSRYQQKGKGRWMPKQTTPRDASDQPPERPPITTNSPSLPLSQQAEPAAETTTMMTGGAKGYAAKRPAWTGEEEGEWRVKQGGIVEVSRLGRGTVMKIMVMMNDDDSNGDDDDDDDEE
jgi:hypothetical protein